MRILTADRVRRPAPVAWRGTDVLVLSPTPTHPQDYGNRNRIFGVCSRLKRRGARITLVHYPAETEWRRRLPPGAAAAMAEAWHAYYTVPVTRPLHAAAQSADHTIDEWWDEAIGDFLRWLFRVAQFDVFIVCYSWLSKAFDAAPDSVVKILDTHDRFAGRRLLLEQQGIAPEFFHTTEAEEAIALNRADVVWAIKEQERRHFEQLTARPVLSLPHLNPVRPLPIPAPDPDGYLRVGIIGAANNFNLTNLRDFLSTAIPIFEHFFAPVMLFIAGSLCEKLRGVDERFVRLVGRVEDVEDFYRTVDLVCIAMHASTGLKTKTGEAIALGLPVVSLAHGFEGYPGRHPLHALPNFAEMAERLVDIAFDRELLPGLRAASLAAAQATEIDTETTLERTGQIVARLRRRVIFCVSAAVFDGAAPERGAFLSAVEYLGMMANLTVLVVGGPLAPLLAAGGELDSKARIVIAAPLVESDEQASKLVGRGFVIGAVDEALAGLGQTIVIVDALSEQLFDIAPTPAVVVLRAELLAQRIAIAPQLGAISAFLRKFAWSIVVAPHSSQLLGELAARSGADFAAAPCCWRSAAIRRQIDGRRRPQQALLLTDPRLHGLALFVKLLADLKLEPILVRAIEPDPASSPLPGASGAAAELSATEYLCGLIAGKQMLPAFAVDLSFGALGLQYLREVLQRLDVPIICARAAVVQPSVLAADNAEQVHTYEELTAQILSAARGVPVIDEALRRRLDRELEGDGGWAWLWRYGFDQFGFGEIPVTPRPDPT